MIKSKPASYHMGFLAREIVNIKMLDQSLLFVMPYHVVHLSTIILYTIFLKIGSMVFSLQFVLILYDNVT